MTKSDSNNAEFYFDDVETSLDELEELEFQGLLSPKDVYVLRNLVLDGVEVLSYAKDESLPYQAVIYDEARSKRNLLNAHHSAQDDESS